MSLPDKILVRPAMLLWLFVKKHPWLTLLLLGLVWLLPPLIVLWVEAMDKVIAFWERSFAFGEKVGNALRKIRDWFSNADGANPGKRFWLLILLVALFAPPLGVFLFVWHTSDRIKTARGTTEFSASAELQPEPAPALPDLDDYYGFAE